MQPRSALAAMPPPTGRRRSAAPATFLLGVLLAMALTVAVGGPAAASCLASPPGSPGAFTGTVVRTDNQGRRAHVHTDDGRDVIVSGTPTSGGSGSSIDRTYVAGARYEFHPENGGSPYRDSICTRTRQLGPPDPAAVKPAPGAYGLSAASWLLIVVGALATAAELAALAVTRGRRRWPATGQG